MAQIASTLPQHPLYSAITISSQAGYENFDDWSAFMSNVNCACAEKAIFELPVNILTRLLDLTIPQFMKKAIIWRSDNFSVAFTVQMVNVPHFYFRSI